MSQRGNVHALTKVLRRSYPVAALALLAGCATGRPCETGPATCCATRMVVENEYLVTECPEQRWWFIRWPELVGPWPTSEGRRR